MDGRRVRGDRTRRAIAAKAAAIASVDGLSGMSLARLADATGTPKSSVQGAFRTKAELQLATIARASEIFVGAVVAPAQRAEPGIRRLWSLIDGFLAYVEQRVFPGGCFMAATFPEFDSRPGPVRDALRRTRSQWLGVLEAEVRTAQQAGELDSDLEPGDIAFEIDALLAAANVGHNLTGEPTPLLSARSVLRRRLPMQKHDPVRPHRQRLQ